MSAASKLSKNMTIDQFDKGYWYDTDIKKFAKQIGIVNSSKLRKDELEELIKHYLKTGQVKNSSRKNVVKQGVKDIDKGLKLSLPVVHYTSNKITKDFIVREALKIAPGLKKKTGARYRLNRWRDEQINKGIKITYGDLVKQYVKLNQTEGNFEKAKSGRYISFLSDFLKHEKNATHEQARKAWKKLKEMDVEKNYEAWKKAFK